MADFIHEFSALIAGPDARRYVARVYGTPAGVVWEGWLEFSSGDEVLVTGRETTQPSLQALAYWATGLEPVYLEGALERARRRRDTWSAA